MLDSSPVNITGAAADLSAKQYRFGKMTSSGPNVCSVAGERADFVIGNKPTAGNPVDAYLERKVEVELGGSVTKGDSLTTDANGKAVTATTGDYVNAVALEGGSSGAIISALVPLSKPNDTNAQAVAAPGALNPNASHVSLSVDGTDAFTLADGAVGHEIEIDCIAAANTPLGTLTIATPFTGESATHVFTAVGQSLRLRMLSAGWKVVGKRRVGNQLVVVGTTVLTGFDLCARYNLSITGAVASTGTQGIPDGQVPGERIDVQCTVNTGGTDEGEIAITAVDLDNAPFTKIDAINATTAHHAQFVWDGAAWQTTVAPTGVVLA
jgi:hypothetical protein